VNQLERNYTILCKYIPEKAATQIAFLIVKLDFKLKITKERATKLGDYRSPFSGSNHQITINHNLNKYAFLITLIHEMAHLTCFNKFGNTVNPHGAEWKNEYKLLMIDFLSKEIFPSDVLSGLQVHLKNPGATTCSDAKLQRILKAYDNLAQGGNLFFLEKLPLGTKFLFKGRLFEKGAKMRTRYRCAEISLKAHYLISGMAEVEIFEPLSSVESSFKIEI